MEGRAYSILTVKSVDDEQRIIRGVASTPQPDRVGDVVDSQGATFAASVPLLLHHDRLRPVGRVTFTRTSAGIEFEAHLPRATDSPTLRDRIEEAWTSIKERLVGGVSIGFRAMKSAMEQLATGGTRFRAIEIVELSLVTVPCNAQCTISTIKSFDVSRPAALGTGRRIEHPTSPGVTGTTAGPTHMSTIAEQITGFENTRAAKVARMAAVMDAAAGEAATLDESQRQEYDGLAAHVKSIDEHLVRLNEMEKLNVAKATPVVGDRSTSIPRVTLKSNLPPGTAFARYCQSIARAKGDRWQALEYAKEWDSTTPEVGLYMKAAVAAGSTTDATWAAPLVPAAQAVMGEFLDLLRPETILGKLTKLTKVPFNVAVSSQTGGGSYSWVGQGKVKPVPLWT